MKRNLLFLLVPLLLSSAFAKVHAQLMPDLGPDVLECTGSHTFTETTGVFVPAADFTFDWFFRPVGSPTFTLIVPGGSASLTINDAGSEDGTYRLVVTEVNPPFQTGSDDIELRFVDDPTAGAAIDLELCDRSIGDMPAQYNDGIANFNLLLNNPFVLNGADPMDFTVTYYTSQPDADMFINQITANVADFPSSGQTIVARIDDADFPGSPCFDTVTFDLIVNPNPAAITPPDLESCDGDNDQFAQFDLNQQTAIITGGDPTQTVNYYLTPSDAENAPAGLEIDLSTDYTNVDPMTQPIYARVTDIDPMTSTGTGCFNIVQFNLIVLPTPTPLLNPTPYPLCDTNADNVEIFDLTSREAEILNGLDPAIFDIVWYEDAVLANDPSPIEPASDIADEVNYVSPTTGPLPETVQVYARVINTTQSPTTRCFTVVTLDLIVNPIPVPVQPLAYELCDDEASGSRTDQISIFDLRSRDNIITGGNANWAVSYYFSEPEAIAAVPGTELPDMYANTVVASQTIWARVQDTTTGCFDTISLTLVVNPNPSPLPQPVIERCDIDFEQGDTTADGLGLFDLSATGDLVMDIENGEANVQTDFYESFTNAENEVSPIPTATLYAGASGSIWARVNNTNTLCFTILQIDLLVNPSPIVDANLPELNACDDDGDGNAIFDLTENEAAIYGMQAPADFNLTYHETQASAESLPGSATDMPIAAATTMSYSAPSGTIWVRLENIATGCINVGSFAITAVGAPAYTPPPAQLFACDTDQSGSDMDGITTFDLTQITDIITASNPDLNVSYYINAGDIPANPIPTPEAFANGGGNPQTILIVIESTLAGMCSVQEQVDLRVNALPVLISDPLPNLVECDDDNDGFTLFDLDQYGIEILNGQTDVTLTFYETEQDATDDTTGNAITNTNAYNNISGMTTLYVRAESVDNMPDNTIECFKVYPFELEAHPTPILPDASVDLDLIFCDIDGSGDEIVDITTNELTILGVQDPGFTYTISYHEMLVDAETIGGPQIPTPDAYLMAVGTQTIYYRILFNDGSECFKVGSFEITLGALPNIVPFTEPLEECDDDIDEIAIFDLTENENVLTMGDPLLNVDYYESQAAIDAGDPPIADPENYQNISNPQLIEIIVTTLDGCEIQTQLTIRVLQLPTPDSFSPAPIVVCDDDFDGFFTFDLRPTINEIDASPDVVLRVFESQEDADTYDAATNTPIPAAEGPAFTYTNSIPNGQTIYVRVDHDPAAVPGNTCYVVVPVDIVINPLPVVNPDRIDPYVFCEQEDGNDSEGILDLNVIASEVGLLAPPQQEGDFNITYHEQQSQAQNDAFALSSPYTFVEQPAPNNGLWVRVENAATECFVVVFQEIVIEARPTAVTPPDMMACEIIVPNDINGIPVSGVGEFDLTQQDELIAGGPLAGDEVVLYFTSEADALNNENEIATPDVFENTTNPQTIWAVVQNTTTTCPSSPPVFFEISVKPTPYTDLSNEGGELCVDPVTGAVQEPVTLDATPETLVGGATYAYTWTLDGAPFSIQPIVEVTEVGVYEVTVTATYTDIISGMITVCDYVAGATYTAVSSPIFEVQILEDSFNPSGLYTVQVIESSIQGFGSADYEFALDDGPFQTSLTFTNVRPGEHIIYGRRIDGDCPAVPVEFGIIDYPRFFTPNQDGFHDTWNILGLGTPPNLNAKIYIFDRYGKLLKQISPAGPGWNGTYNGQPMPSSDYWFSVEYIEPGGENALARKNFNGHFTLKR